MGKFMKPGKVVMVLAGRYAGRKAVIVKVSPEIRAARWLPRLIAVRDCTIHVEFGLCLPCCEDPDYTFVLQTSCD